MNIERINTYQDKRFPQHILQQHGAFLCDGQPYEVEIISQREAVIRGPEQKCYAPVIDEFRFFAGHISRFYDETGTVVLEFPEEFLFPVKLEQIQPSQFYVDQEKAAAVKTFIHSGEDIVIPLLEWEGRYLSLDGHTRMFVAEKLGIKEVLGFLSSSDDYIYDFAREAQAKGIDFPGDLIALSHEEYADKWHKFCEAYFAEKAQQEEK